MRKNLVLITALSLGSAGIMVASPRTYHVTLAQNSVVEGQPLKAGSYKIQLKNDTATLQHGRRVVKVPARAVMASNKFDNTEIEYTGNKMQKIDLGGTHTSIVFASNGQAGVSGGASGASSLR